MQKIIVMPRTLNAPSKIIRINNTPSTLLLKINKQGIFMLLRNLAMILLILGFLAAIVVSYTADGLLFWTLIKLGTILGLLIYLAYESKQNAH